MNEEKVKAAFDAASVMGFLDVDGNVLKPGDMVHYAFEGRHHSWNQQRWGVITGMARTTKLFVEDGDEYDRSIRVHAVDVTDKERGIWDRDEWFVDPARVRLIRR